LDSEKYCKKKYVSDFIFIECAMANAKITFKCKILNTEYEKALEKTHKKPSK